MGAYAAVILLWGAQTHSKRIGLARWIRVNPALIWVGSGRAGNSRRAETGVGVGVGAGAGARAGARARAGAGAGNGNSGGNL